MLILTLSYWTKGGYLFFIKYTYSYSGTEELHCNLIALDYHKYNAQMHKIIIMNKFISTSFFVRIAYFFVC